MSTAGRSLIDPISEVWGGMLTGISAVTRG
jgi:hypothetical protein